MRGRSERLRVKAEEESVRILPSWSSAIIPLTLRKRNFTVAVDVRPLPPELFAFFDGELDKEFPSVDVSPNRLTVFDARGHRDFRSAFDLEAKAG